MGEGKKLKANKLLGEPITDASRSVLIFVPNKDEILVVAVKEETDGKKKSVRYDRYNYSGKLLDGGNIRYGGYHFGILLPKVVSFLYGTDTSAICLGETDGGWQHGINH